MKCDFEQKSPSPQLTRWRAPSLWVGWSGYTASTAPPPSARRWPRTGTRATWSAAPSSSSPLRKTRSRFGGKLQRRRRPLWRRPARPREAGTAGGRRLCPPQPRDDLFSALKSWNGNQYNAIKSISSKGTPAMALARYNIVSNFAVPKPGKALPVRTTL